MTMVWPSCSNPMRGTATGYRACSSWLAPGDRDAAPGWRPPPTCRTGSADPGSDAGAGCLLETFCRGSAPLDGEQLSGLAAEHVADGGEGAVPDRLGPVVLHDAQVDQRDAHLVSQRRQRHLALLQE